MNLASILVQPVHDFALVMAAGGEQADLALRALAEELYTRFGPGRG